MAGAGIALVPLALTPALSAILATQPVQDSARVSLRVLGSIGSFTPVTRDEHLAKFYADAARQSQTRHFRFTPAKGSMNNERSLTILVRATPDSLVSRQAQTNINLTPMAFSLGKVRPLGRITGEISATHERNPVAENVALPTSGFVMKSKPSRFSTNLQLEPRAQTAVAPTASTPQTLGAEKSYSVDLSSSYSLTRNLDVQAGVRYRGPDNRLVPLTDQKKDTQAVYVGTKFKF